MLGKVGRIGENVSIRKRIWRKGGGREKRGINPRLLVLKPNVFITPKSSRFPTGNEILRTASNFSYSPLPTSDPFLVCFAL